MDKQVNNTKSGTNLKLKVKGNWRNLHDTLIENVVSNNNSVVLWTKERVSGLKVFHPVAYLVFSNGGYTLNQFPIQEPLITINVDGCKEHKDLVLADDEVIKLALTLKTLYKECVTSRATANGITGMLLSAIGQESLYLTFTDNNKPALGDFAIQRRINYKKPVFCASTAMAIFQQRKEA